MFTYPHVYAIVRSVSVDDAHIFPALVLSEFRAVWQYVAYGVEKRV